GWQLVRVRPPEAAAPPVLTAHPEAAAELAGVLGTAATHPVPAALAAEADMLQLRRAVRAALPPGAPPPAAPAADPAGAAALLAAFAGPPPPAPHRPAAPPAPLAASFPPAAAPRLSAAAPALHPVDPAAPGGWSAVLTAEGDRLRLLAGQDGRSAAPVAEVPAAGASPAELLAFLETLERVADLAPPADRIGPAHAASPAAGWARALLRNRPVPA